MTPDGRSDAVVAEIRLADEELRAADQLLAAALPRVALSRAYFAAFHAARAQLFAEGLEPKTHAGVQHLFNLNLIRPGKYEVGISKLLARLQKFREEADYATAFVVDDAGAREEVEAARRFVAQVRGHLAGS